MVPMFKCKACGAITFKLVIDPNFDGRVDVTTNAHDDVMITAQWAIVCGRPDVYEPLCRLHAVRWKAGLGLLLPAKS